MIVDYEHVVMTLLTPFKIHCYSAVPPNVSDLWYAVKKITETHLEIRIFKKITEIHLKIKIDYVEEWWYGVIEYERERCDHTRFPLVRGRPVTGIIRF